MVYRGEVSETACTKCTACTVVCPVSGVTPLYAGPKQSGPDQERWRRKGAPFFDGSLKLCLNCKRCEVACPSGVHIGDLIQRARTRYGAKWRGWLRGVMLGNTDLVGAMATRFAWVTNSVMRWQPVRWFLDVALGIDKRRVFPTYTSTTFTQWFNREAKARQGKYDRFVAFFHGCYVNWNYPQQGKDVVTVLNALGFGVRLLEKEQCCGVALMSNGMSRQARRQGAGNLSSIRKSLSGGVEAVVGASSTCIFTMRDEYPNVLDLANGDVRDSLDLITRFVVRQVEEGGKRLVFKEQVREEQVAYHAPCHLLRMGWESYTVSLLRRMPVRLTVLDSHCCGIAGTYGFKRELSPISQQIGAPLFAQIHKLSPDCVSTDCETCKWQIEMSTRVRVEHPISLLARMLDVPACERANGVKENKMQNELTH